MFSAVLNSELTAKPNGIGIEGHGLSKFQYTTVLYEI